MTLAARPALLLNADYRPLCYFPLSTIGWEDAVRNVVRESVAVVAEYPDAVVRSPSTTIRLPSVVALRQYQAPAKRVAFTRFNVFLRDRFRCQYCGRRQRSADLTFDHVIPRSKGGATRWDNIVAACFRCNMAKDDRDLAPLHPPHAPGARELMAAQREFPPSAFHESWLDYLYWDSELQT